MERIIRIAASAVLLLGVGAGLLGCQVLDPTPIVTSFTGGAGMLTDPFTLPAGAHMATLTTLGYCIVHVVPVAAPDDITYLFACWAGEASVGESALYVSDGTRIMLEFSNVSAPYTLEFEAID
ncbi:MAG: hypothetical protein AB1778_03605 [Candidatus Bipolaricaulota bacterium]